MALTLCSWVGLVWADEPDLPLTKSPNPYRGRVVELLTDAPLVGALVLLAWPYRDPSDQDPRRTFALRETVTDVNGGFVIDAADIESSAPPGAQAPRMVVWKPGYVSLPREYGSRFGVPVGWLAQRGGVINLKPVKGFEERILAFNVTTMSIEERQSSARVHELPLLMRLAREEVAFFARHSVETEKELRRVP